MKVVISVVRCSAGLWHAAAVMRLIVNENPLHQTPVVFAMAKDVPHFASFSLTENWNVFRPFQGPMSRAAWFADTEYQIASPHRLSIEGFEFFGMPPTGQVWVDIEYRQTAIEALAKRAQDRGISGMVDRQSLSQSLQIRDRGIDDLVVAIAIASYLAMRPDSEFMVAGRSIRNKLERLFAVA